MAVTLEDQLDALKFEVERSIRYHHRRRAFFERLHRSSMFLVIVLGSAAVANWNAKLAGLIITTVGAADLVIGFSNKARDHQLLAQRFGDLARRIRLADSPTDADARVWEDEKLLIDADEPPIYRALEADCYNEVCRAWGRPLPPYAPKLDLRHKLLMHVWRFEKEAFEPKPPAPAAGLAIG
jgi:hypothetical protein